MTHPRFLAIGKFKPAMYLGRSKPPNILLVKFSSYTVVGLSLLCLCVQGIKVSVMENVLSQGRLKVSSNDAMSNSLTDGSTETFWESRDEPRGRARQLTVTFEKERKLFAVCVHIDNQKDAGVSKSNSV